MMTLTDSLILAAVGVTVVMVALGALALFIVLMSKVVAKFSKTPVASAAAPAAIKTATPAPVVAPVAPAPDNTGKVALPESESRGDLKLNGIDDKDAALIMAILADELGAPLNTLVFKSIKEV